MKTILSILLSIFLGLASVHASRRFDPIAENTHLVTATSAVYDNLTVGSVSVWVYMHGEGSSGQSGLGTIVYKRPNAGTDKRRLIVDPTVGAAGFQGTILTSRYSSGDETVRYNEGVRNAHWTHLVAIWYGDAFTEPQIYVNGTRRWLWPLIQGGVIKTNLWPDFTDSSGVVSNGTLSDDSGVGWYIGAGSASAINDYVIDASIAELAIFSDVLTPSEILSIYRSATGVPTALQDGNLEGYWHLCGDASPEPDSSGNGNDATLSGNPPTKWQDSPGYSCGGPGVIQATGILLTGGPLQTPLVH